MVGAVTSRRADVIELLLCAADRCHPLDTVIAPFAITQATIGADRLTRERAESVMRAMFDGKGSDWQRDCLEAARRLEEGWTP